MVDIEQHIRKAIDFKELHTQTFILPNAWDAASAKVFEQCGFKAVGTTSAGIAAAHGYTDRSMPFDTMLAAVREIVQAVSIPVTVDMEDGYGSTPEEVANSVRQVIESGAVGINLEDSKMNPRDGLYDISDQQKKIAAIRQSITGWASRCLSTPGRILIGFERERRRTCWRKRLNELRLTEKQVLTASLCPALRIMLRSASFGKKPVVRSTCWPAPACRPFMSCSRWGLNGSAPDPALSAP